MEWCGIISSTHFTDKNIMTRVNWEKKDTEIMFTSYSYSNT